MRWYRMAKGLSRRKCLKTIQIAKICLIFKQIFAHDDVRKANRQKMCVMG